MFVAAVPSRAISLSLAFRRLFPYSVLGCIVSAALLSMDTKEFVEASRSSTYCQASSSFLSSNPCPLCFLFPSSPSHDFAPRVPTPLGPCLVRYGSFSVRTAAPGPFVWTSAQKALPGGGHSVPNKGVYGPPSLGIGRVCDRQKFAHLGHAPFPVSASGRRARCAAHDILWP